MITRYSIIVVVLIAIVGCTANQKVIAETKPRSDQKAVLVTGASTGIGRKIAETLAKDGIFVYAGARKQRDLEDLGKIPNVKGVRLDVTIQDDIDAAVKIIQKEGRGLYGLVNNAGVAINGPLIELDETDLKWLFDVNVFGPYRVTQAFAPMIIESKGRITTTGSISGILSGPMLGHYSMSKHAIEAYTDALASEMARFDVQVSVIEPGNYRTDIAKSAVKRMAEKINANGESAYAEDIARLLARPVDRAQYKEPDDVAAAAMHALFSDSPKRRYMVVPVQQEAEWTIRQAIKELVELNADHEFSYSQSELVEMLNQAINLE